MGLLSFFSSTSDDLKGGRYTEEEARDAMWEEEGDYRNEIEDLGTDTTSTERVVTQTKKERAAAGKGGTTYFQTEVSPTDFVPNPDKKPSAQTPDYYRNGCVKVHTETIDGKVIKKKQWAPVPLSVGERSQPTLANIRLINPKGVIKSDDPRSPGDRLIPEFSKFFLTAVQESHQEKVQTVETFNDWYAFFYGEKPPIYNFSGYLLNLSNYNWLNEFMYYYQNFWRGTKAVDLGGRIYLTYNYQQVQGYILNVSTNINAATDKGAPFSISMLVTKRKIFNGSADDGVIRDNLMPGDGLIDTDNHSSIISKQLVSLYLSGKEPAKRNKEINDGNIKQADQVIRNSSQSTVAQDTTRIGEDTARQGVSRGASQAASLRRASGLPSAFSTGSLDLFTGNVA